MVADIDGIGKAASADIDRAPLVGPVAAEHRLIRRVGQREDTSAGPLVKPFPGFERQLCPDPVGAGLGNKAALIGKARPREIVFVADQR